MNIYQKYSVAALVLLSIPFFGAGCTMERLQEEDSPVNVATVPTDTSAIEERASENENSVEGDEDAADQQEPMQEQSASVALPIEEYAARRTLKTHGEYIEDRFTGYHAGDDIEYGDIESDVPVYAIADGVVQRVETVSGYGGLIVVEHTVEGRKITALYGHLDIAQAQVSTVDEITIGQQLGILGDHESIQTDGERKHLHFALYEGADQRVNGYVQTADELADWINPQDFFTEYGVELEQDARTIDPAQERGGDIFPLEFTLPSGWGIEYVPSIESWNLYTLEGSSTARERAQIFIRYFDASSFLTLSTVTIHSTQDTTVGTAEYTAKQYDIEKNSGVADFPQQPSWRNARHLVTDFRAAEGYTRYYVVGQNPAADQTDIDTVLSSITIK